MNASGGVRRAVAVAIIIAGGIGCGGQQPAGPSSVFSTLQVNAVEPRVASTAGGTEVTVHGRDFAADAHVTIGGIDAPTTVVDDTILRFIAPRHDAGLAEIVVNNPNGESTRAPGPFTYVTLRVTTIVPSVVYTRGGARVVITAENIRAGATVMVGGVSVAASVVSNQLVFFDAPSHDRGPVDVTLTNPGGDSPVTVPGALVYEVAPDEGFNGTWEAFTPQSPETVVFTFVIRDLRLVEVTCGRLPKTEIVTSPPVAAASFDYQGSDGRLAGALVADGLSRGSISWEACSSTDWTAYKK